MNKAYRAEKNLKGTRLNKRQRTDLNKRIDARLKELVPYEFGIDNYFPHMFTGNFLVKVRGASGEFQTIGSAKTATEAMSVVAREAANNRKLASHDFRVESKGFTDPDMVRLSKGRFGHLIGDLKQALKVDDKAIQEAIRGNVGMMMTRKKPWGNIKKRLGAKGYSKDLEQVMRIYTAGISRYKHLTQLNREVQPLLEQLRAEGRSGLANYAEKVFDQVWGNRHRDFSAAFDASLQNVPGLKNVVMPFALERWTSTFIKSPVATLKWKLSARGQALNLAQTLQTTLATVDAAEYAAGAKFYASKEGRAALHRHGVRFFAGKAEESARTLTPAAFREKARIAAPETFNQEVAWSILYNKARTMRMDDAAAAEYAFLKGNVQTQFTPLRADVPPVFRGAVPSTIGMFRRFGIKDLELGFHLLQHRAFGGFGKWLGAKLLLGGTKALTHPLTVFGGGYLTLKAYQKIKEDHGEQTADFIAYGLPGLVGLDMSYSIQLLDTPRGDNVAEELGNTLLGPAGNDAIRYIKAWKDKTGPEKSAFKRLLHEAVRSNPALRTIEMLYQLDEGADNGLYNFRSASGKLRFRNDLKGVFVNALGGKVVGEKVFRGGKVVDLGPFDVWAEAVVEMRTKRDERINDIALSILAEEPYEEQWNDWLELYPDFPITKKDIVRRVKSRFEGGELTQRERMLKHGPKALREEFTTP